MLSIKEVYELLFKAYGPQGWWPVTEKGSIKPIYFVQSLTNKQRFEVMVGSILTQNTSWTNVEKALENVNKENVLDIKKMQKMDEKRLARLITPAGYFNQKASYIINIANHLKKNYKSELRGFFIKPVAELRAELLAIKGIGPETADSMVLYAAEKPMFVIDAYTKRIFSRLGFEGLESYERAQHLFMDNLEHDVALFKEYHALIVAHAKNHCKKEPSCQNCPLQNDCLFNRTVQENQYILF